MSERLPTLMEYVEWFQQQSPELRAVIAQQIRVELLAEEAVATSAIEGVKISRSAARAAAARRLQENK